MRVVLRSSKHAESHFRNEHRTIHRLRGPENMRNILWSLLLRRVCTAPPGTSDASGRGISDRRPTLRKLETTTPTATTNAIPPNTTVRALIIRRGFSSVTAGRADIHPPRLAVQLWGDPASVLGSVRQLWPARWLPSRCRPSWLDSTSAIPVVPQRLFEREPINEPGDRAARQPPTRTRSHTTRPRRPHRHPLSQTPPLQSRHQPTHPRRPLRLPTQLPSAQMCSSSTPKNDNPQTASDHTSTPSTNSPQRTSHRPPTHRRRTTPTPSPPNHQRKLISTHTYSAGRSSAAIRL